jgi:hypothetical protein
LLDDLLFNPEVGIKELQKAKNKTNPFEFLGLLYW